MLTFVLETPVELFLHWLTHHTTDWHERPIDRRYGRAIWERAPVLDGGRTTHKFWGHDSPAYIALGEYSGRIAVRILGYWEEPGTGGRLEADLEVQIIPLAPSRTQVWFAEVYWPDTCLFLDLLKDIARCYPEARGDIEAWIESNFPSLGESPPLMSAIAGQPDTQLPKTTADAGTGANAGQPDKPLLPKWLPKTAKTLKKWREAYRILCKVRKEWRDPDDWGNDTTLKLADYRDALRSKMGWRPSEKTVSRILRAGDAGLL